MVIDTLLLLAALMFTPPVAQGYLKWRSLIKHVQIVQAALAIVQVFMAEPGHMTRGCGIVRDG